MSPSAPPVAIVTGAGSGIGRAACVLLAEAGHRLALVGRTETKLAATVEHIGARGGSAPDMLTVPADVSDAAQARSVVEMTMAQWGRVDALVNNAGAAPLRPIDETDEDLLYRTFAINTFAAAHLIAACWPVFRRQRGGRIVNVSSIATVDPFPGFFVYAASKAALESLTRSAAGEGHAIGVRAFSVVPGAVETEMLRAAFSERDLPRDRTLDPIDVARVIRDCVTGGRDEESGGAIRVVP